MTDSRRVETQIFDVSNQVPVVVQFFAKWCGPCQAMKPTMKILAQNNQDRCKFDEIDIEKQPGIALQFGITSIPTVVIFHKEQAVAKLVGGKSSHLMQTWLDNNLPQQISAVPNEFVEIQQQLKQGNLPAAMNQITERLIEKYSDEPLLKVLRALGSVGKNNKEALSILNMLVGQSGNLDSLVNIIHEMVELEEEDKDVQTPTSSPVNLNTQDVNSQIDINAIDFQLLEQLVALGINEVRNSKGAGKLTPHSILHAAALDHNNYMMQHDQLTHQQNNPNKRTVKDRILAHGGNQFRAMGENVQYKGFPVRTMGRRREIITGSYLQAASDLVTNWVKSPGHYRNLINPDYQYVGTSIGWNPENASLFATQVFGA